MFGFDYNAAEKEGWDLTNKKKELDQIPGPISITYYIIYLNVLNSPRGSTGVG
jgi:hypothetical protein